MFSWLGPLCGFLGSGGFRMTGSAEPQGCDDHRDADVQVGVGGHVREVHADEPDVEDEQQDDAADVSGCPAEAGDLASVFLLPEVVEHRVVVDGRELEEHVAEPE